MNILQRTIGIAALLAGIAAADTKGTVTIDTSALANNANGPFTLDLQFIEGNGAGDSNNTVTLFNFSFGGGSIVTAASSSTGGVAVSTSPFTVTLTDSSFFQDVQFTFTPGSILTFQFDSTSNVDVVAPDTFTVAVLDNTLTEIPTDNPNGFNSFLEVDLPTANTGTQVIGSSDTGGAGIGATVSVITACDASGNPSAAISDVQKIVNQALGAASPASDVNRDGVVNVADIQLVMNAALGQGCPVS